MAFRARTASRLLLIAAGLALGGASRSLAQTAISGNFLYTTYGSGNEIGSGTFNWNGTTLTATTFTIATLPSFAIDGSLALGSDGKVYSGRAGAMYIIDPGNGTYVSASTGVNNNVTSIDPMAATVWAGWKDTSLASHTVGAPAGSWTTRSLSGSDGVATGLAWVPIGGGNYTVWYTTGGENVTGNVGTVDLTTGVTTRYLSGVSATNITYDSFTNTLFAAGINGIVQINPTTHAIVSSWTNPLGNGNYYIQQLSATGSGQLLAFNSDGNLLIWDMSTGNGLIGDVSTVTGSYSTGVLSAGLQFIPVPEPATYTLLAIGALAALSSRTLRRRRQS